MNWTNHVNCQICSFRMGQCGRQDYTIEEHLRQFRDDEHYKVLYDLWELEKKEYENRLKVVGMRYQTYSQHDVTHSEAILRQIACFLGEDRIKQLSPTDTWLLLECAYCHDLGMVVTAQEVFDIFSSMDLDNFNILSEQMYRSENVDIKRAWSYLEPLFKYGAKLTEEKSIEEWSEGENSNIEKYKNIESLKTIFDSEWYKWPLYFTQAFMLITQEYCRPKHAQMSYNKIMNEAEEKAYEGIIPLRLRYLIAEIVSLHTADSRDVIKKLTQKVQGIYIDNAHPRFIAELLRIGDLLDMDNNRFNKYQLAVAGNPSYNSFAHQLKHRALRDFLVMPHAIVIHADFNMSDAEELLAKDGMYKIFVDQLSEMSEEAMKDKSVELTVRAFKEMSGWLGMLRKELEFLSIKWFDIIPEGFTGSCAIFDDEKLLIDGGEVDANLLNLRYQITPKRASQIIEGAGLYHNPFRAFIREILQNSMDAVKRQVYENIQRNKVIENKIRTPLDFYRYIVRDLQQIRIEVNYSVLNNNEIQLTIRDYGIGITYERLQDMQYIGDMLDYKYQEQDDEMPYWWKPTGSFGIGMQTIFYFTKIFHLKTRTEKENLLRKMAFHSTQIGGKIDTYFVNDVINAEDFGYGTEIKVRISYEMMKAAHEKGFFATDLDYFGKNNDHYKDEIRRMLGEIRGCFGIPVTFDKVQDDERNTSRFLKRCFGECFVNIKTDDVQAVVDEAEKDGKNGFSCWDEENKILIRYKYLTERRRIPFMRVYLNEILVDSYPINKIFNIEFWETEVYLFSSHAENLIEINRESFLNEKQRYISKKICDTHLKCMRILIGKSIAEEHRQIVWPDDFYKDVQKYYKFLLLGSRLAAVDIGIRVYIRENRMLHCITKCELERAYRDEEANAVSGKDLDDSIWLMDMRHRYTRDIRLMHTYEKVGYIAEDILYGYQDLAICEMEVLEEFYGEKLILYKTADRSGMPVKMSEESIRQYILYKFNVDRSDRLILPGMEEYGEIRVLKLIGSLGTDFEKRFDSAMIFPLSLMELESLLEDNKKISDIEEFIEKVLNMGNPVYSRILDYVKRYRCNYVGEFNMEEIKKKYKNLILYVLKVIREGRAFLKEP